VDLYRLGWNDHFAEAFAGWDGRFLPARVISENRGHCEYQTEEGTGRGMAGGKPVTGDWVVIERATRRVVEVLPRRTWISRKKAGRTVEEQVLAANVDVLGIVTGLDGDFNPRRLERYLILAAGSGAEPLIVLNKLDLCDDPLPYVRAVDRIAAGAPVLLLSALDAASVRQFARYIQPGQTAVLLGSSGAGKSTLVNALLGRAVQDTSSVREHDSRGRHATTGRRLFVIEPGWLLIDTPGLREIEPWAAAEAVDRVFDEIGELAARCRFADCRHEGEPGCAVAEEAAAGRLDESRLNGFRKLRREMDHLVRMQDERAAQEHKRKMKAIHRGIKEMYRQREA
jgi:ribosome biogenesis GTPase / thiamine phosphate phosphatase